MENIQNTTLRPNDTGSDLDFMYVVLVYVIYADPIIRYQNPCVGTLLSPDLVLTTHKCVEFAVHGAIDLDVILIYMRDSGVLTPGKLFLSLGREKSTSLALILLSYESKVTHFPSLPVNSFTISQTNSCVLCGFGTEEEKLSLMHFKAVTITRTEISKCSEFAQREENMCLHFSSVIPCRGDVGSPLICDGVLQGIFNPQIVPRSPNCLDTYGADFTPIYPLMPWIHMVNSSIEESVWKHLNSPWILVVSVCAALVIISIIYYAVTKFIDWKSADMEDVIETQMRPVEVKPSMVLRSYYDATLNTEEIV